MHFCGQDGNTDSPALEGSVGDMGSESIHHLEPVTPKLSNPIRPIEETHL